MSRRNLSQVGSVQQVSKSDDPSNEKSLKDCKSGDKLVLEVGPKRRAPEPLAVSSAASITSKDADDDAVSKITSIMQKQPSEMTPMDTKMVRESLSSITNDEEKLGKIREIARESGIEDELMKKLCRTMNPHGESQPSRKEYMKAKKQAKKSLKLTEGPKKPVVRKAIFINRSKKVKIISYEDDEMVVKFIRALTMTAPDMPSFTSWGRLVVVHNTRKGHIRNKAIERIFNRDAAFGDEVVVFLPEGDLGDEKTLQTLAKEATRGTLWSPPEPPIEEETPEAVLDAGKEEKMETPEGKMETPEETTDSGPPAFPIPLEESLRIGSSLPGQIHVDLKPENLQIDSSPSDVIIL